MNTLNFIGGEKGGVGKSVVSRVLAQYFIDKSRSVIGFDTDRSHNSFTRFYSDYASPVIVDTYEGLDVIASAFEDAIEKGHEQNVIVDLAAQTGMPLTRWIKDSDLFSVMAEMHVRVNFWHVADVGNQHFRVWAQLLCREKRRTGLRLFTFGRVSRFGQGDDLGRQGHHPESATRGQHAQD